ncbi:MAG: U32 family peptidase [Eubacteriales bacterium]|nr:U32 family peptidase [Eubacteriales bacterium]MDD4475015.1 U32 family peptidase [Eubacteriales bacterium]
MDAQKVLTANAIKKPELLAPAGSFEAVCAAVYSGCNAVYLGGKGFNARANASNFELDEMKRAADLCRLFKVKLYITMNTILYDRELRAALRYASELAEKISPDAFIIQDIGFASMLHKNLPDMPLHASTQMRLHSADASDLLKEIGITRIVLAREMNLSDIKKAAASGVETEVFVHGALCVSQSGGCLMSSMIGKRSGNRGECAQPCRLPYKSANRFPLSLKDLCLAGSVTKLMDSGVTSLKIEGRMKSPDYVAGVVSVYRRLIDKKRDATKEEMLYLDRLFSRQGFTDGYLFSKPGRNMFGYRTETDKITSKESSKKLDYYPLLKSRPEFCNQPPSPTVYTINEPQDKVIDYIKPLNYDVFRFYGDIPKDIKFPEPAAYIDIPLWKINKIPHDYAKGNIKIRVIMPAVCTDSDKAVVVKLLSNAKDEGISDLVITNLSQLNLCDGMGFSLHGDIALNAVNELTLDFYKDKLSTIALSPEVGIGALKSMKKPLPVELVVYGKLPLMYTENCIIESAENKNCDRNRTNCKFMLTDRTGAVFPIFREYAHRNVIFNSVPLYLLDKKKELKQCGISGKIYLFTDEKSDKIKSVIKMGEQSSTAVKPFTRGYFQ